MPLENDNQPVQTPPTTPPVPTPAPAITPPTTPASPPSQSFSLREFAASQNFDVSDFQDDAAAAAHLFDQLKQSKAVAAWAQQNVQPQPKPEPAPSPADPEEWTVDGYFSKRWDVPKYDPQWEAMADSGAIVKQNGKWVPAEGYDWIAANPALQQLNAWESKRSSKLRSYLDDNLPRKIYEDLREPLDRRYLTRDQVIEMLEQRQATQQVATVEERLSPLLYKDPANIPGIDDPRFNANLTEYGQKFFQAMNDLMELNPSASQQVILQKVLRFAPPPTPAAPQAPPASAPPAAPAAPVAPAQPQSSFLEDALAKAGHRPSGSASPATTQTGPKHVSSLDLKNLIRAAG